MGSAEGTPVTVLPNRQSDHLARVTAHQAAHGTTRRFGAGSARNMAAEAIDSDVIAFMDDDAEAAPDWIAQLLSVYRDPSVVAVGGAPLPRYETVRPAWFPANFDWVFGCAYAGLPSEIAPLRHLIGANMSVRRTAFEAVGGFVGSDFDDLNLCMRLSRKYGAQSTYYNPHAVVRHFVPGERVTWRYFWRRCYFVNREKVRVFRRVGSAANLIAEREFVLRALTRQIRKEISEPSGGKLPRSPLRLQWSLESPSQGPGTFAAGLTSCSCQFSVGASEGRPASGDCFSRIRGFNDRWRPVRAGEGGDESSLRRSCGGRDGRDAASEPEACPNPLIPRMGCSGRDPALGLPS